MDNVNFTSTNSSFDNPANPYVLPSTKEEMDARKDLDVYQRNGTKEQNHKESLQEISSATQEKQSSFQQSQLSTTSGFKSEWSHNHHNYSMGSPLLPLHDQLSLPKKSPKEESQKDNEIHKQISFSPSRLNSSMDNYNRLSQKLSNNDQCLLEVKSTEKDYERCIWCVNFSPYRGEKDRTCFSQRKERPIPSSSGPEWRCDPVSNKVDVWELCGDECLDYFMSVQTRSSNQVSNSIYSEKSCSATMELPSLSELVESVKNNHGYRKFHEHKDKWLIDQEYFSDTYGITNVHPLLVDGYGANFMFLDDRGILFEWCAVTESMYIFGINIIEGLANLLYHPEKKFIIETNGELVLYEELKHRAIEAAKLIKFDTSALGKS